MHLLNREPRRSPDSELVADGHRRWDGPALHAAGVAKVYGGTIALRGVDFAVRAGEIHGLLGENGAGKSTLIRIISGVEAPDAGSLRFFGSDVPSATPSAVSALGCAFIHQHRALVEDFTVAENIAAVVGYPRRHSVIDWRTCRAAAKQALARLGVEIDVEQRVAELPVASQAIVAIARALAQDARLLFLDEPTATLQQTEASVLFAALARLREQGVASVLISHRIDEVLEICDRVTILRDGAVTGVRPVEGLGKQELMRLIVGRDIGPHEREIVRRDTNQAALGVDELVSPGVGPLSLAVNRGEIVAATGLGDGGHLELGEALVGLRPMVTGRITVAGRPYTPSSVRAALDLGLAYLPANRVDAAAAMMSLRENLFMSPAGVLRPLLRRGSERALATGLLERFDVRPPDPERQLGTLSGGNQQKVALAKWISQAPELLVLNEPTAAVDVGAKADIYRQLRSACAESGLAILLITSDFEEVEIVADRAYVLVKGCVVDVVEAEEISVSRLTRASYSTPSLVELGA